MFQRLLINSSYKHLPFGHACLSVPYRRLSGKETGPRSFSFPRAIRFSVIELDCEIIGTFDESVFLTAHSRKNILPIARFRTVPRQPFPTIRPSCKTAAAAPVGQLPFLYRIDAYKCNLLVVGILLFCPNQT